jgi:hypothetical protein
MAFRGQLKTHWLILYSLSQKAVKQDYLHIGDYILGAPTNKSGRYWDQELNAHACATIQIGRVTGVNGNNATLDDIGLNADAAGNYDAVYISRLK